MGQANGRSRVSVITPSYNQVQFIEDTILSVKSQCYPNIEHIVVDGGSTDGTLDVLAKYSDDITWISEPDDGQTDAINKGFRMSKGEILAELDSDDVYVPGAIDTVAGFFEEHPDVGFVYGDLRVIDDHGMTLLERKEIDFDYKILLYGLNLFAQPTSFFRRSVPDKIGYLDPKLNYAMDLEFFLRAAVNGIKFKHIPKTLAAFRLHSSSKTVSQHAEMQHELRSVMSIYRGRGFKHPLLDSLLASALQRIYRSKKCVKKAILRRQFDPYAFRRAMKKAAGR